MARNSVLKSTLVLTVLIALAACGRPVPSTDDPSIKFENPNDPLNNVPASERQTIFSIFNRKSTDTSVSVNKYLWSASLEVLSFLPVQSIDPYTGVIVTGYGTPPGSGQSYRATVLIDDPALDARSLNLALQTRGGRTVNAATSRAVEDAILSRAREMRIADNKF